METLTVINQKGGVGKSTTALAIGQGLLLKGYKVLFIDLDMQGNLSYTLEADTTGYNAMGILQRPETTLKEIQHTAGGDIIASTPSLSRADSLLSQTGKEFRLKEALEQVAANYDYCIIDTPPALGVLTINALTASHGVIVPTQADIYSMQGLLQLHNTIEAVKKYCNPTLKIEGILITRFNERTRVRKEVARMLEEIAQKLDTKVFRTRVRECTAVVEAQAYRKSIYQHAPTSNATADYKAFIDELLQ